MDEELLKEIDRVILECFNKPPVVLYKGIDPLTRKAVNTSISLNLLYESKPHQYKLSDSGMRVVQLGSTEKYLSELESKTKEKPIISILLKFWWLIVIPIIIGIILILIENNFF